MWNKKLGYKLFFLTVMLTLPFIASGVLAELDSSNEVSTAETGTEVSTSTLSDTNTNENLEFNSDANNLGDSTIVENTEAPIILTSSTAEVEQNLELPLDVNTSDALIKKEIIEKDQADWIKNHEKYKQIKKSETDGKYEVHEYQTPTGEVGYQVFLYDDSGELIESKGYGVEAESRTWTQPSPTVPSLGRKD